MLLKQTLSMFEINQLIYDYIHFYNLLYFTFTLYKYIYLMYNIIINLTQS